MKRNNLFVIAGRFGYILLLFFCLKCGKDNTTTTQPPTTQPPPLSSCSHMSIVILWRQPAGCAHTFPR